ncbi:chemotaxis protein [Embleya sp. NBC_00896]|uniref:baeRF3 domain-containing protein n=1 Tax=Embleya sp. NBC_00896 TaxID=2975961 RepID=UPI00386E4F6C|nr:chemotaxis protein [Embleya sp. NBC_00896]
MTTADLSPELLAELRRPRAHPAVSATLPTHRHRPENQQDHIRLRNVLAEAEKRLAADPEVSREARIKTADHLKAAAAELDPEHFLDGLVLYASADEHYAFTIEAPVSERVVFATTYLTRNLVSAAERLTPYWALVLSDHEVHLWHGRGEEVHEVRDGGFPVTSGGPEPDGPLRREGGGMGVSEEVRRLLHEADEQLAHALAGRDDKVVLVGLRPQVKAFRETTRNGVHLAETELEVGGLADATPGQFAAILAPARTALAAEATAAALSTLDDARSAKRYAGGIQEVWAPARAGRGALLVVEEGLRVTGRLVTVDKTEEIVLQVLTGPRAEDAVLAGRAEDDIVDTVVEAVLEADGKVVFVPDGTLADAGGIAMWLRY